VCADDDRGSDGFFFNLWTVGLSKLAGKENLTREDYMKEKRLFGVVLCLAITVAILVVAGSVYERIGRRRDRQRFAQVGTSFDIGGRTLNVFCSGSGSPTVILEGGYSWINEQREIAKFTRACWYERAGQGWSDPGPSPQTATAMAGDLHDLLRVAAIQPPYVLVGASFGGFPVRVFAGKYPDEVAGIVLVDSAHEDQQEPPSMKAPINKLPPFARRALCALLPTAGELGIVRLMSGGGGPISRGMTPEQAAYSQFLTNQPKSVVAAGDEGCNWERTAAEVRAAGNLGDRPLIVLTPDRRLFPTIQRTLRKQVPSMICGCTNYSHNWPNYPLVGVR